jgi:hypothetical protein
MVYIYYTCVSGLRHKFYKLKYTNRFVVFFFLHNRDFRWNEFINCDIRKFASCYNNTKLVKSLKEIEFIIRKKDGLSLCHSLGVMHSYLRYLQGDLDSE